MSVQKQAHRTIRNPRASPPRAAITARIFTCGAFGIEMLAHLLSQKADPSRPRVGRTGTGILRHARARRATHMQRTKRCAPHTARTTACAACTPSSRSDPTSTAELSRQEQRRARTIPTDAPPRSKVSRDEDKRAMVDTVTTGLHSLL